MVAPSRSGRLNRNVRHKAQREIVVLSLRILHEAWPATAADSRVTRASDEDSISNVLRWQMSQTKARLFPDAQIRFEREPQSDRLEGDSPLGLIDIMVAYTWDESTYLTMECKRITSTDNTLALEYVRNGINRFAIGKYSPGHAFGIVVGYVICGNSTGGIERVRKTLAKEPATETGYDLAFGWQGDKIVCPGHLLYRTRHKQASHKNDIELIHAFVSLN